METIGHIFLWVVWIVLIVLFILSIMEVNGKTIILRRCSWHKKNFGWTKYMGFKIGNFNKNFGHTTDGICKSCLEKL